MEYVKLWTTFHDDPSIQNLSARAIVYYVNALSWAGRHETGGVFVPVGKVPAAARELIAAGKFEARDDGGPGWRIHGWPERQIDMDSLREKRKQAGRLGGLAKAGKRLASASVPDLAEVEVEEEVDTSPTETAAPNAQQEMFGGLLEVFGYAEPLAKDDRSAIGGVAKALLDKGLVPDDLPGYVEWLTTDPATPLVNGRRLTLHSLPRWVKDYRATPRIVTTSPSNDRVARLVKEAMG